MINILTFAVKRFQSVLEVFWTASLEAGLYCYVPFLSVGVFTFISAWVLTAVKLSKFGHMFDIFDEHASFDLIWST